LGPAHIQHGILNNNSQNTTPNTKQQNNSAAIAGYFTPVPGDDDVEPPLDPGAGL
jgi:hypothetical protein